MAQEILYSLIYGRGEEGLRTESENDSEPNPEDYPEPESYVYDDGTWVLCKEGTDEWIAMNEYMSSKDNMFAVCFIPHSAITIDENKKITKILLPGE